MELHFKAPLSRAWTLEDNRIVVGRNTVIKFSEIKEANIFSAPTERTSGIIRIVTKFNETYDLGVGRDQIDACNTAIEYICSNSPLLIKMNQGCVYDIIGALGRHLFVYEDRVIIRTNTSLGSVFSGKNADEKAIYYADCIGVQFKEKDDTSGYLQFETASNMMSNISDTHLNENTFVFDTNEKMNEVAEYIRARVSGHKQSNQSVLPNSISAADEIKKFKELLDIGAITQEEFDMKKKQLLGL